MLGRTGPLLKHQIAPSGTGTAEIQSGQALAAVNGADPDYASDLGEDGTDQEQQQASGHLGS